MLRYNKFDNPTIYNVKQKCSTITALQYIIYITFLANNISHMHMIFFLAPC